MARGTGLLPRSFLPLLAVLAAAVIWLLVDRGPEPPGAEKAGPLFPVAADSVAAVEVENSTSVMRLERGPDGWALSGTLSDLVEPKAADDMVAALLDQKGSDAIDAPVDWRAQLADYRLDPERVTILTVIARDGREFVLRIGGANPASGLIYATGAGRDRLFYVDPRLADRLGKLPNALRLVKLCPEFHPLDVDTLTLRLRDEPLDVFARDEVGRWWLREPADGFDRIDDVAAGYHRIYSDRRRLSGGVEWLRASDAKLANMLFFIAEANIHEFDPVTVREPASQSETLLIGVSFSGKNPPVSIGIGPVVGKDAVAAGRNDSPYRFRILKRLLDAGDVPLADFLETTVLSDPAGAADSIVLTRIGEEPIRMGRESDGWVLRGDYSWSGTGPTPDELAADMVPRLDRLAIERALQPAVAGEDPLQSAYRTDIVLGYSLPGFPDRIEMIVGVLADGSGAGAWFPDSGALFEVDRNILSTLRSLFMVLGSPAR